MNETKTPQAECSAICNNLGCNCKHTQPCCHISILTIMKEPKTPHADLESAMEKKKEKFLIACEIKGKFGAIMLEDLLTATLQSFIEAEIERLEGIKKDDTPYSGHNTACCNATEQEGEDGMLHCEKCGEHFPELINTTYNQAIDDQILHFKELLVTLKR